MTTEREAAHQLGMDLVSFRNAVNAVDVDPAASPPASQRTVLTADATNNVLALKPIPGLGADLETGAYLFTMLVYWGTSATGSGIVLKPLFPVTPTEYALAYLGGGGGPGIYDSNINVDPNSILIQNGPPAGVFVPGLVTGHIIVPSPGRLTFGFAPDVDTRVLTLKRGCNLNVQKVG